MLSADPEPADAIPPSVWLINLRALQKKPGDRFASTAELASALNTCTLGTQPSETAGAVSAGAVSAGAGGWWGTHQLVTALAYWSMAWPAWEVHKWTGRYGVLIFLASIVVIVVAGNLRLHLWFTSRMYPAELPAQRAYVGRWIRSADYAFALLMTATGLVIADAHTGWGALFVAFGLGAALGFLIIEPTTSRAES